MTIMNQFAYDLGSLMCMVWMSINKGYRFLLNMLVDESKQGHFLSARETVVRYDGGKCKLLLCAQHNEVIIK